ncbi:M23 family metallopeptidase [Desertibacillus haloalkaliphilus]|uniref:M23 family metallopeptidase n=1 Tax=Desertibacillus haloalkaliphilus TaxID=1328930 RepID=UPI001C26CB1B|nr:M23 family metallopeptidase [Desertibacillus haloalkaliphilus]MBU8906574.1 M23 family metallopeptidase [Desertibacillus haloalkaliphilus]
MRKIAIMFMILTLLLPIVPSVSAESIEDMSNEEIIEKRMDLYQKTEALTNIPWYFIAAVDYYERGLRKALRDRPKSDGVINIFFSPRQWVGPLNPDLEDENPLSISMFGGWGKDGNGDGIVSRTDDEDVLYSFANYLETYGYDEENIRIALWDYYQREQTVNIITGHARVFKKFDTVDLRNTSFPVPLRYNYSYKNTWGDRRGWGGRRIHEGTDIFANHNVPVRATAYGVVEIKGWNRYGGWRVGIRDIDNVYHYFAHLSGFEKGIEVGTIVEPGDVIGYVGSSGYGKPGTQGKFPPHLHYGMYRDNGITEWSFDPYPSLKSWEKKDRAKK